MHEIAKRTMPEAPPLKEGDDDDRVTMLDLVEPLATHWKRLVLATLLAGALAIGATYLLKPTYTASTTFVPPQQQQSMASTALASLGPLAALAGVGSMKSPAEQYVALLESRSVTDRLIDRFNLMQVYDVAFRVDARGVLASKVRIALGKRDGLITVQVEDHDRRRAADIANAHVDELRHLASTLALTEAQQRRVFFEGQLQKTRDKLTEAQLALQASGFGAGAIQAEPKAAAEAYARLRAEAVAAEVRLQTLRKNLAENTPEVQQQAATLGALRRQVSLAEQGVAQGEGPDYVGKYREFKYHETLFELLARQYELARVDEAREGAVIQVIDPAAVPEKKSKPKRLFTGVAAAFATLLLLSAFVISRHFWRQSAHQPRTAEKVARLRAALGWH